MRTTVELADDLIAALHALAIRKGYRGYSRVMEEAVKYYLREHEKKIVSSSVLMNMRGSWKPEEAAETKKRVEEIRKNWNHSQRGNMKLQHTIKAIIRKGERYYVAECVEIAVVTQGKTIDETLTNLQEAVALHLEGENLADLGLSSNPTILLTMELEPAHAHA